MKISINTFIVVMVACAFAAASPIKTNRTAANSGDSARPIVNRSANFGADESINLFVDGSEVSVIGYNDSYDAPLAPGDHLLSVSTTPDTYPEDTPKRLTITAQTGKHTPSRLFGSIQSALV